MQGGGESLAVYSGNVVRVANRKFCAIQRTTGATQRMAWKVNLVVGLMLVGLTFVNGACVHRPVPVEGKASFSIVDPIETRAPLATGVSLARENKPLDMFVPGRAIEPLAQPNYPAAALGHAGNDVALVGV